MIALLTLAGAFARIYGLGIWGYSFDEMWHVYVAKQPTITDVFYTNLTVDGHPALPYIPWHYLLAAYDIPWMARVPSVLAGIACIPLAYLTGKEIFVHKNGGIFAAFFTAFSPLMIEQSDVVRGYMLMMFFLFITLWSVYRYRHTAQFRYMLLYFFSAFGAFSCEFSAAPIIAFAALYLVYGIHRQPYRKPFAYSLWAIMHLMLLAYLLWFMQLFFAINSPDFFKVHLSLKPHDSLLTMAARIVIYFCNFINDNNIFLYAGLASAQQALAIVSFVLLWLAAMVGFTRLLRDRKWHALAASFIPAIITIGLDLDDKISMDTDRHMIGLVIPLIILLYYGGAYCLRSWRNYFTPITLAVTLILCLFYGAYGNTWRYVRTEEFHLTHEQIKDMFTFLDEHVAPGDAILTDWEGYYHFWENHQHCRARFISPLLSEYPCYKAPVYIISEDARNATFLMMPITLQQAAQQLDALRAFVHTKKIWLLNIENIDGVLNAQMAQRILLRRISKAEQKNHAAELGEIIAEQEEFARYAYKNASPKKIAYAYNCADPGGDVEIGALSDCELDLSILALPKSAFYEKIIRHVAFHDPLALLERINQE